jgi:hypothetical protein
MRAGLLAELILGENSELRDLVNQYNFIILNPSGKITGFNHNLLQNSGLPEKALMNQNFYVVFQPEDGNADLSIRLKAVLAGEPGPVEFSLPEKNLLFKGIAIPIYDDSSTAGHIIILAKEEFVEISETDGLEQFWASTKEFLNVEGISAEPINETEDMKKPRILLVEDHKGLISKIFSKLLKSSKENVMLEPSAEAAILMAAEFKPHAVISTYEPIGEISSALIREKMLEQVGASTILVSTVGGELRIEDGWLDIHVKNQAESVSRILDLINQIYLD